VKPVIFRHVHLVADHRDLLDSTAPRHSPITTLDTTTFSTSPSCYLLLPHRPPFPLRHYSLSEAQPGQTQFRAQTPSEAQGLLRVASHGSKLGENILPQTITLAGTINAVRQTAEVEAELHLRRRGISKAESAVGHPDVRDLEVAVDRLPRTNRDKANQKNYHNRPAPGLRPDS
jgi:hypothetical protein